MRKSSTEAQKSDQRKSPMKLTRSFPFNIKRSDGRLTGLGHLALSCQEINLSNPWFVVATKVRSDQHGEFDQQFLSFSEERLSELLAILDDEKDERRVYVVSAIAHDPRNGMRIDRLREVWRASYADQPLVETIVYVLADGSRFDRQIDCAEPIEWIEELRLLVRV